MTSSPYVLHVDCFYHKVLINTHCRSLSLATVVGSIYRQETCNEDFCVSGESSVLSKIVTPSGIFVGQLLFGLFLDICGRRTRCTSSLEVLSDTKAELLASSDCIELIVFWAILCEAIAGYNTGTSYVIATVVFLRFIFGTGVGALSALTCSQLAAAKGRRRIMASVFAARVLGSFIAAGIAWGLVSAYLHEPVAGFQPADVHDDFLSLGKFMRAMDKTWRPFIDIGWVCATAAAASISRLTLKSSLFLMDTEGRIDRATKTLQHYMGLTDLTSGASRSTVPCEFFCRRPAVFYRGVDPQRLYVRSSAPEPSLLTSSPCKLGRRRTLAQPSIRNLPPAFSEYAPYNNHTDPPTDTIPTSLQDKASPEQPQPVHTRTSDSQVEGDAVGHSSTDINLAARPVYIKSFSLFRDEPPLPFGSEIYSQDPEYQNAPDETPSAPARQASTAPTTAATSSLHGSAAGHPQDLPGNSDSRHPRTIVWKELVGLKVPLLPLSEEVLWLMRLFSRQKG